ncbi:MAG: DUF167 domain-containing protein [Elusimicrobiota bacterium]
MTITKIKVQPRAKKCEVTLQADGTLKVRVTAPPIDGKANHAVIETLAEHFNTKKSNIHIISGHKSNTKIVDVLL